MDEPWSTQNFDRIARAKMQLALPIIRYIHACIRNTRKGQKATHTLLQKNNFKTRKPRKGAPVIAASMHGFASCRKFKSPVTLILTLDRVKVISTYAVYVELPAYPTM